MDRTGRRTLLLVSFWGMAACLATLSAFMLLPSELPSCFYGDCRGWAWTSECVQPLQLPPVVPHWPVCAAPGTAGLTPPLLPALLCPFCPLPLPPSLCVRPAAPKRLQGAASLGSVLAYMVFFALGAGPIPFLYLPEVLPQEIMGTAQVGATHCEAFGHFVVCGVWCVGCGVWCGGTL